jgi:hypothetical protein
MVAVVAAHGQDSEPSLGEVARQARQQKQQKDAQANDEPAKDAPPSVAPAPGKDPQSKSVPSKDAQSKDASVKNPQPKGAKKVVTNDEIPQHVGPTSTLHTVSKTSVKYDAPPDEGNGKVPAEYWKNQILAQKAAIASLQSEISNLKASIQYAGGNCVSGCVEWNEHQQQKQDQLEAMKSQLEAEQNQLEAMQDMARKQGYGTAVYDP